MSLVIRNIFKHQLPLVYQSAISECGLASLSMVMGYHGHPIDIQTLRSRYLVSTRGLNFYDIQQIADQLGLAGRGVRVKNLAVEKLTLPAILHWNNNHFVVLKKVTKKTIIIHDPAYGYDKILRRDLENHFQGIAMEFIPTPAFEIRDEKRSLAIRDFIDGFDNLKGALTKIVAATMALEIFSNLIPLYTQIIIDDVIVTADINLLHVLLIGYLSIISFHVVTSTLRSWMMLRLGVLLNVHIQTRVLTHLLRLPGNFFEQRHIGDIVSRFGSLHQIQSTLTTNFAEAIVDGIMSIVILGIIFAYSPFLSLVTLAFLIAYGLLRWARYVPLKELLRSSIAAKAKLDTHFLETIRASRSIQLFNRRLLRRDQWFKHLYEYFNKDIKVKYFSINYAEIESFMNFAQRGIVLYLGAKLILSNQMTIGSLIAFLAYKDQLVSRTEGLILKLVDFGMLRMHIDRLADIVNTPPESEPELPYLLSEEILPSVTIENLSFRYSRHEPWILKDFNMHIDAGEHVAITGKSGIGKSTILKLIMGLLTPEEGNILVGGVPIVNLGPIRVRNTAACVMQDDHLFSGTLLENITFFAPNPDIAHAEFCAQIAEIHNDILQMKMAYNTVIGDLGTSLSSGQKQRILIARALYSKPKILILDESTSNLDIHIEKKITSNINDLNITRISISHRTQTIQSAARCIQL